MADLVIKDLKLSLGQHEILKGVSLTLSPGQVVALLGPSGSGKTTLLRAIAGLETPSNGSIALGDRIFFDAASSTDLPTERRGLGLVFQSYALWPHRSVFDNIASGLVLRGVAASEIATRVGQALDRMGLGDLADRFPPQLSGGQQQRVAIARAVVYESPLILLDEPLSNLDAKLREEARIWLRDLIVTLGLSAIHVTHDQVEAMAIADRILLLDRGAVAQEGTPTSLYNEPRSLFAAEFMGANNRLDGVLLDASEGRATIDVSGARLTGTLCGDRRATAGTKATGIIRLERMRIADAPGPNRIAMQLQPPIYLGERWELVFKRGDLVVRSYADTPLPPGDQYAEFPPEALWVF
ncbi:MAG: ATP-binding cassette domain-containing protein [Rhodopseudomonas sp.]|nr:ATP-binding cassette domain-containing protein [Rhodopseudomonas sp.]